MGKRISHNKQIDSRKPYDQRDNPCTRDCPDRKAECAKTCPRWAIYAAGRAERYKHNEIVYMTEDALRIPVRRDKRGQI